MENNRKKFLDKVVDFIVKDTTVDFDGRELFFPFTLKKSLRQNSDNSTPFHKILFNRDSVIPRDGFMEYIDEMYGINTVDEISYVWGKYKDIMRYNIFGNDPTSEPIYESDDKRKRFLDKVVDFYIKDTEMDYEDEMIVGPFLYGYSFNYFLESCSPRSLRLCLPSDDFISISKSTYDLSMDEVEYVWDKYKKMLLKIIKNYSDSKESEKVSIYEDSRQDLINKVDERVKKLLDKIVDSILRETVIEYGVDKFNPFDKDEVLWYPPFSERLYSHRQSMYNTFANYDFNKYCQEVFSIYDEGEILYMWERYRKLLDFKMRNMTINESGDKRKRFLDKVVDFIFKDTGIDGSERYVSYPWDPETPLLFNSKTDLYFSYEYFRDYVIETYGLTLMDEMVYVWEEYRRRISDKLSTGDMINESDDKKQVYLNKVVDWLVRDTEVDVNHNWFSPIYYYPGSTSGRTSFKSVYEHTFGVSRDNYYSGLDTQLIYFNHYCKEQYGLTGEETKIVWYDYMKRLKESYDWRF